MKAMESRTNVSIVDRIRYVETIKMTPAEWIAVPTNPRQRDTERRASRAKHLHTPRDVHRRTNMARLPDGSRYKLDGHTRAWLWAHGRVLAPREVLVDVYEVKSDEDVLEAYTFFDARAASKDSTDDIAGALRHYNPRFESELLASGRFAQPIRAGHEILWGQLVTREKTTFDLVAYWMPQLLLLDQAGPTRRRFPTGVTTAALITIKRHGAAALDFWRGYEMNAGEKLYGEMDAVQAFVERIERIRRERRLSGRREIQHIVAVALSAFEAHRKARYYRTNAQIKAYGQESFNDWLRKAQKSEAR